jgi:hypothetical protein
MSSNQETKLFAVRFIQEGKQLRSETPVQGITFRPSNKGAQPVAGETWLCSRGFRPEGANFRYVICKQQVVDGAVIQPGAPAADSKLDMVAAPDFKTGGTAVATGNSGDRSTASLADMLAKGLAEGKRADEERKRSSRNQHSRKPRHQRGEQKGQAQGGGVAWHGYIGTAAPAAQPTTGNHKKPAGGATTDGDRHQQGRKPRHHRDERTDRPACSWSSAPAAIAPKRPPVTRLSNDAALARAKVLIAPAPKGRIDMSDLRFAFSQKRAETDAKATELCARLQFVTGCIAALDADPRLELATATMSVLSEDGRKIAVALYEARKKKARLEAEQKTFNAERLRALGKEGKSIKAAGDKADPGKVASYKLLKDYFAALQAPLTESLRKVKEEIYGTKESTSKALEWQMFCQIEPFWSDRGSMESAVEDLLKAMSDVEDIYDDRQALLGTLVGLVYDYDKRLNQLG